MRVPLTREAGHEGFWLARRPGRLDTSRIDVLRMVRAPRAWDRGEAEALSRVRIPTVGEEDARLLMRRRERFVQERTRLSNTIVGLLKLHGIHGLHTLKPGFGGRLWSCGDGNRESRRRGTAPRTGDPVVWLIQNGGRRRYPGFIRPPARPASEQPGKSGKPPISSICQTTIIAPESRGDGERVLAALGERPAKHGLTPHPTRTRHVGLRPKADGHGSSNRFGCLCFTRLRGKSRNGCRLGRRHRNGRFGRHRLQAIPAGFPLPNAEVTRSVHVP